MNQPDTRLPSFGTLEPEEIRRWLEHLRAVRRARRELLAVLQPKERRMVQRTIKATMPDDCPTVYGGRDVEVPLLVTDALGFEPFVRSGAAFGLLDVLTTTLYAIGVRRASNRRLTQLQYRRSLTDQFNAWARRERKLGYPDTPVCPRPEACFVFDRANYRRFLEFVLVMHLAKTGRHRRNPT